MADRILYLSWGTPVRGLEERGLDVFNDAIGLYGRMQQEGRIEAFDVMLLRPNGAINGCMILRGSADQMHAVRESEEFQRVTLDAAMVVDDLRVIEGYCEQGIADQMGMYQQAMAQVPQRA
jgi:hypothetical protein